MSIKTYRSDGARFMEIGNQVFMQYRRQKDGNILWLKRQRRFVKK